MKIAFFDAHRFDREAFARENQAFGFDILYLEARLEPRSASMAEGCGVVCSFVNDRVDAEAVAALSRLGVGLIALRSAGFNHVDLGAASRAGIKVARVPEYSPFAVAEHAFALLLTLNRKIHRAHARVHEMNFSLEGLVGFDLHGKTVGVVGTGRIGSVFCRIARGFGCRVLAHDAVPDRGMAGELSLEYVTLEELYRRSDIISLHLPLGPSTLHMIDNRALGLMKPGVYLINTGRGGLIDAKALTRALKSGQVGGACLDVYEEEEGVFFQDLSDRILKDDVLARLLTFPNVLITSHQAFLTREALANIARTTLENIRAFESGRSLVNEVKWAPLAPGGQ